MNPYMNRVTSHVNNSQYPRVQESFMVVNSTPEQWVGFQLQPNIVSLKVGDSISFTALLNTTRKFPQFWEVSDPAIGTIDPDGRFHALKSGTTTVRAYFYNGLSPNPLKSESYGAMVDVTVS